MWESRYNCIWIQTNSSTASNNELGFSQQVSEALSVAGAGYEEIQMEKFGHLGNYKKGGGRYILDYQAALFWYENDTSNKVQ